MLLAREKKIVTLLMEHEDKLTTTQIATSLKVSSRTIKTDIKKINEELEKHSCRINSQQGVGLWIEYDNHEAQKYLKEVARDTVDSYLSPEVRKYHLAVELLLKDDYTSMEALAKEYYISKASPASTPIAYPGAIPGLSAIAYAINAARQGTANANKLLPIVKIT